MTDFGLMAQVAAERHIENCEAWLEYEENGKDDGHPAPEGLIEDPSSALYDGCQTCVIREILFAAWPIMVESEHERSPDALR